MHTRLVSGALALATTTMLVAACGSSTPSTSAPQASAPTTSTTVPMSDSSMPSPASTPMDSSMPNPSTTEPTADSMPMETTPMGTDSMETDSMGTMDMGGSNAGTQGLNLKVGTTGFASNQPTTLTFTVLAADESALTHFQVEQTKLLHLILVRSDLTSYQHIHPSLASDGTWTVPVTFPQGGSYRMVADFVPVLGGTATARVALTTDLTVTGAGADTALPAPSTTATADGYTVQLAGAMSSTKESTLTFTITDAAGKAVALEPYLGAYGHLVAFAQADLAYTHIHPSNAVRTTAYSPSSAKSRHQACTACSCSSPPEAQSTPPNSPSTPHSRLVGWPAAATPPKANVQIDGIQRHRCSGRNVTICTAVIVTFPTPTAAEVGSLRRRLTHPRIESTR